VRGAGGVESPTAPTTAATPASTAPACGTR
jgi:hypothetical protein